jgi:hypothetical protein
VSRGTRKAPRASGPDVWDIPEWCGQLGIGRTTFDVLEVKPKSIRIGKLRKIIESPIDYLIRVGKPRT